MPQKDDIGTFTDLKPIELDFRSKRTRGRKVIPRAIGNRVLGDVVRNTLLFDSRRGDEFLGASSNPFDSDGLVSVGNNLGRTITTTITSKSGFSFIPSIEVSWYIDAVVESNEFPSGTFFNLDSAGGFQSTKQSSYLYDLISFTSAGRSTDTKKVFLNRLVNKTGAAVKMGVIVEMSYILNGATS